MASLDLSGRHVLVVGVGVAGASATRALVARGAEVLLTATTEGAAVTELVEAGASWLGPLDALPPSVDLVVASPGVPPTDAVLVDAAARDVEVWGEVELAWRLRADGAAPWLALTGTNGKTTTVHMLEAVLRAAGHRAVAVGNVGVPLIDAVLADPPYDVLAVELSSQQLHFAPSVAPAAGALLNLAPDHLNWHGSYEAYEDAKTTIWRGEVAIGNVDDVRVAARLPEGAVTTTLGEPGVGQLGVRDGRLVSRAFGDDSLDLLAAAEVRPPGRHNVANALIAAAIARAIDTPARAVAEGLRAFEPDPHRNQAVLERDGVTWVDDSKATNPHAAAASLSAYPRIVWVAGGQLKGVDVDPLVAACADRLAGAVLLGQDRELVRAALARHAPDLPVIMVDRNDDGAMTAAVRAAADLARPGDTVLLAPAAASYDMFTGFAARGDAFAAAARALGPDVPR
ncbi:UDP-N-acetylmuramoyl-L-alanine--D-glutamate ligase [uncultured Jatrophihabitans sp.]|uniref:UDP-N-acetylmuramoyl-L-alanine--D-glutamate ligase n=1 Tax=uncultured Jatrophihabitans sp. TaxID=1610747 RepID=UPI0035CA48B6